MTNEAGAPVAGVQVSVAGAPAGQILAPAATGADAKAVLAGLATSPGRPAIAIQAYTEIGTIQPLRLDRSARTSLTYVTELAQGSAVRLLWTGNGLRLTDADSAFEGPKALFRNIQPGAAERLVQVRLRAAAE